MPQRAPTEVIQELRAALPSPSYGIWWDLPLPTPPSPFIAVEETSSTGQKVADSVLCLSFADSACAPAMNKMLTVQSVLGRCRDDSDIGCIENLQIGLDGKSQNDLAFVEYTGAESVFEQSTDLNVPRGSSASRWRASDGTEYLLVPSIFREFSGANGQWNPSTSSIRFYIARISPSSQYRTSPVSLIVNPGYSPYKVIGNGNSPVPAIEFAPSTYFQLGVRIPNSVTGWFTARLDEASVSSRSLSGNRSSYTFGGYASKVHIAGGAVTGSSLPADFIKNLGWGSSYESGAAWGSTVGSAGTLSSYKKWEQYLPDRDLLTQSRWAIGSQSWGTSGCFSPGSGINAVLATNAAVFDGSAPVWNSATGQLSFEVASPHLDSAGRQSVGTYSLAVPSASVKCLYGRDSLPKYFQVIVDYSDAGEDFKVVSALSESGGWVSFSASGFHFSSPVISVRFGENPSSFADQQLDVYTSNRTADTASPKSSSANSTNYVRISAARAKATLNIQLAKKMTIKIYRKVGSKTVLIKTLSGKAGKNTFVTSYRKNYSFIVKDSKGKVIPRKLGSASFRLGGYTVR